MQKNNTFSEKLKRLSAIAEWFDSQEDVDVEEGLIRIKEAAILLKESKKRLQEVENEFQEIKKEIDDKLPSDKTTFEDKLVESEQTSDNPL